MTENRLMDLRALLLADDDERRALERALHDGAQQELVALAVELQVAAGFVERDPQEALRRLEAARTGVRRALNELRDLAARAEALGGTLELTPSRVAGTLPLGS
jgi:signal transduction histidine kinase